jgi:hypothetical protein
MKVEMPRALAFLTTAPAFLTRSESVARGQRLGLSWCSRIE